MNTSLDTTPHTLPIATFGSSALADLDAWDSAIADLDAALGDATTERRVIEFQTAVNLPEREAELFLSAGGANAEERKARLVLAKSTDDRYQDGHSDLLQARCALLDAERRATMAKERCRLLRAALALAVTDH